MTFLVKKPGAVRASIAVGLFASVATLAGCNSTSEVGTKNSQQAEVNEITKFSSSEYGVEASPRMTTSKTVKKGGGRELIGRPYKVRGKWYTPKEDPNYDKSGLASWYGPNFHGRLTANGEIYDQYHLSAAHPTFPLPSYARVTNKKNGHSVIVRVNDRGPFAHGRIIDLSSKAADLLTMKNDGVAAVQVEYVGRAPIDGDDMPYLMASYQGPGQAPAPQDQYGSNGVMLAMNGPTPTSSLPGIGSASAFGSQPQAPLPQTSVPVATAAFTSESDAQSPAIIPIGFALPDVGPVLELRPNYLSGTPNVAPSGTSMAKASDGSSTLDGYRDIGLAYRGNRVTIKRNPFELILTGRRN